MNRRKAVRYALTENPVRDRLSTEATIPEYFRQLSDDSLFALKNA
jgi:hypothetical protein